MDVCRRTNNIGILMLCMYRFPILIVCVIIVQHTDCSCSCLVFSPFPLIFIHKCM